MSASTPETVAPLGALVRDAIAEMGAVATEPMEVDSLDASLTSSVIAFRSELGGAGSVVTLIPDAMIEDATEIVVPLVEALASALTVVLGTAVVPSGAVPATVADLDLTSGPVIGFEISSEPGATLPVHWLLEPGLVAALEGAPVASQGAVHGPAPAPFPEMPPSVSSGQERPVDTLSDVPLEIAVELGRTRMRVGELADLCDGSIVGLDRPADTAVSVYANGRLIAKGDAVVVDDELGVRVTEVVAGPT